MLCKSFNLNGTLSADIVLEYSMFKRNEIMGSKLKSLVSLLEVLPISSAVCEQGFSQMNLYHTPGRNRLMTATVNDLMMIGVNGPPLCDWNVNKYVISWLKQEKHGALDKATGLPKKDVAKTSTKLFA